MKVIETREVKIYGECLSVKMDKTCNRVFLGCSDKTFTLIEFIKEEVFSEVPRIHIMKDFTKSVKSVFYTKTKVDEYYGCVSYDGTGVVYKNGEVFDTVEGPETEIKHVSFDENTSLMALSTRGKTVWILKVNEDCLEIDSILEDHFQDVKGAKFFNNQLFTYGYDETIKVYSHIKAYDNSLTLINNVSLKSLEFKVDEKYVEKNLIFNNYTVWDILFFEDFIVAAVNTEIFIFDLEMSFKFKQRVSDYPIYEMVKIGENKLFIVFNENSLKWLEIKNFRIVSFGILENICLGINSIDFNETFNILVVGGDELFVKFLKIEF